jgi:hypothetical protein
MDGLGAGLRRRVREVQLARCNGHTMRGSSISAVHIERTAHPFCQVTFPQIREAVWSGAGSNRRPSAFQVNHAKRYADLQKRTSLTSENALGGRCEIDANTARYASSNQAGWNDQGQHGHE